MSLGLLAPLGLAALAALLLPLLVHLSRSEEQVPTDFAALRWLAAKFRPRQRLRFEEIVLLVLRLLLVAALALLLARPVLLGSGGDAAWLVVLPGADVTPALNKNAARATMRGGVLLLLPAFCTNPLRRQSVPTWRSAVRKRPWRTTPCLRATR